MKFWSLFTKLFLFFGMINAAGAAESIECYRLYLRISDYDNHTAGYSQKSQRAALVCEDEESQDPKVITYLDIESKYFADFAYTETNQIKISFKHFNGRSLYEMQGTYAGIRQAGSIFIGMENLKLTNGKMIISSTSIIVGLEASVPAPFITEISLMNPATKNLTFKKAKSKYLIPEPW